MPLTNETALNNAPLISQVQEQFQQQLHEQQQKIQLLQAVVEKQKEQIESKEEPELPNVPLDQIDQEDMSNEAIKMAFSKLQVWHMVCVTFLPVALTSREACHANMLSHESPSSSR